MQPFDQTYWTYLMTVAWVATRDADIVDKYAGADESRASHMTVAQVFGESGTRVAERYVEDSSGGTDRIELELRMAYERVEEGASFPFQSVPDAEEVIRDAFERGSISVLGLRQGGGEPASIAEEVWPYLEIQEDRDGDLVARVTNDRGTWWSDLRMKRDEVLATWPEEQEAGDSATQPAPHTIPAPTGMPEAKEMDAAALRLVPHAQREATPESPPETSPASGSTREAKKAETLRKYARWNDLAQWIKSDEKTRTVGVLAAAVGKMAGVKGSSVKKRLTEHFPGWAK